MCSPLCVFIHTTAQFISPRFHFHTSGVSGDKIMCSFIQDFGLLCLHDLIGAFSLVFVLPPNGRFIHISKVAAVINCVSFLLPQPAERETDSFCNLLHCSFTCVSSSKSSCEGVYFLLYSVFYIIYLYTCFTVTPVPFPYMVECILLTE